MMKPAHLSNIELLWKLVENRAITVFILFYNTYNECYQLVPEIDAVQILGISLRFIGIALKLPIIQLVSVLEKKLIGGSQTSLHTVLDYGARSWWTSQLLNLHTKKCDTGKQIDGWFEIHELVWTRSRKVVAIHGEIYSQWVVELVKKLDEFLFLKKNSKCNIYITMISSYTNPQVGTHRPTRETDSRLRYCSFIKNMLSSIKSSAHYLLWFF